MKNKDYPIIVASSVLVVEKEKGRALLVDKLASGISKPTIRLTPITALILSQMDGTNTIEDIASMLHSITGIELINCRKAVDTSIKMFDGQIICNSGSTRSLPSPQEILRNVRKYNADELMTSVFPPFPSGLIYCATENCTFHCKYCFAGAGDTYNNNETYLPLERWESIVKEAREAGTDNCLFGGGDPMLRNDLEEYISIAHKYGLYSRASTRMALSENRIKNIKHAGLDILQISIDSPDCSKVDFLSGKKGTYRGIMQTINYCRENNLPMQARSVITNINYREYEEWVEFCIDQGMVSLATSMYFASCGRNDLSLHANAEQVKYLLDSVNRVKEKYNDSIEIMFDSNYASFIDADLAYIGTKRPYCMGSKTFLLIKHDGRVSFCDSLHCDERFIVGDINTQSINEIWNGEKLNNWRNPKREVFAGTECENCKHFDKCMPKRCYMRSSLAYGTPYEKDPWCPYGMATPDVL